MTHSFAVMEVVVTPGNDLYYKAVHRTAEPEVFQSKRRTQWRIGTTQRLVDVSVVRACGYHACKHPAAPYFGFGYTPEKDVLLIVKLEGDIDTDGIVWAGTVCTPLRVVSNEEWRALVKGDAVVTGTGGTKYNGTKYFVTDGFIRYDDSLPSIVCSDGVQIWMKHNEIHRDGDKPAIVGPDGNKQWWKEGVVHREHDLPAYVSATKLEWYTDGGNTKTVWASGKIEFFCRGSAMRYSVEDPEQAAALLRQHWHGDAEVSGSLASL